MKFPGVEHSLIVMSVWGSGVARFAAWFLVGLSLVACERSMVPAPVVYGGSDKIAREGPAFSGLSGQTVTVRNGDALYKIARRHKVGLRSLIDVNGLKPPYVIYPGQKLRLPSADVHIVQRGETVYQIASRYNTEPGTLVRLNRIQSPYRVFPGQKVVLPGRLKNTSDSIRTARSLKSAANPARKLAPTSQTRGKKVLPSTAKIVRRTPPLRPTIKTPPASRGGFIWPVNGRVLSRFGSIGKGLQNDGINILAQKGTPVRATQNGVVAYAGNELRGFGNLLLIKHSGGWISAYAHNSKLLVRTGQMVRRGQVVSRVGKTGSVEKPQLHFELRRGNRAVNPERYLGRRKVAFSG